MPNRNIELKAHLADLAAAHETARQLPAQRQADQHQIDTYFHCTTGRLKLREINGSTAQLIGYARANQAAAKGSDYTLVDIDQPTPLKEALARTLGVWLVVDKQREIYLWQNVRLHFDQVHGLGTFLEFEAVLGEGHTDAEGFEQLRFLSEKFGLAESDLVEGSYSDLLCS
jgi:predicted adenylyl cyclase CyaB